MLKEPSNENSIQNPRISSAITLDRPTGASDLQPTPQGPENNGRNKLLIRLGVTAAGVAVAAGAIFGVGSAINNGGDKPPQATESSAPADNNTGNEGEISPETPVESLSIPTGLTSAELGEYIVEDIYDEWSHAGANEETVNEYLSLNVTREEFAATVAARNTPLYATAMFGEDYKSNTDLDRLIGGFETENAGYIAAYLSTVHNEQAAATYTANYSVDPTSVVELSNDSVTRTIDIPFTFESNADSLAGLVDETSIPAGVITVTTTEKDGKTIVTAYKTRN